MLAAETYELLVKFCLKCTSIVMIHESNGKIECLCLLVSSICFKTYCNDAVDLTACLCFVLLNT